MKLWTALLMTLLCVALLSVLAEIKDRPGLGDEAGWGTKGGGCGACFRASEGVLWCRAHLIQVLPVLDDLLENHNLCRHRELRNSQPEALECFLFQTWQWHWVSVHFDTHSTGYKDILYPHVRLCLGARHQYRTAVSSQASRSSVSSLCVLWWVPNGYLVYTLHFSGRVFQNVKIQKIDMKWVLCGAELGAI